MQIAKFFLMGAVIVAAALACGVVTKADEVRVSAYVVFIAPTATNPGEFTFTSTFLYQTETDQLVSGSVVTSVVDTLGGTPYTNWVPKPNFHDPNFTYFDPDLDGIVLGFVGPNGPSLFLQPGSYTIDHTELFCATRTCQEHFSPVTGDTAIFPVAGELTVSGVPEPRTGWLVICGALVVVTAFLSRSRLLR